MKRRDSTKKLYTLYHLDSERGFRGGERQLLYLARYLQSQGHDNVIACRKGSSLAAEVSRSSLQPLYLPFIGEWDPVSAFLLKKAASRARHPVIFHAHTGHTAALAFLASRLSGFPRVVHRRVDFAVSGTWSRRLKYDSADAVVAVSEAIRGLLEGRGLPPQKVRIVHDCIPITREEIHMARNIRPFEPAVPEERQRIRKMLGAAWDAPAEALWIGNMAAMVPHKDQANLVQAMAHVHSKIERAHLFLIGEGPLRPSLESLAQKLNLAPFVHFVGRQNDPVSWLQALDLFVLSSWGEGMGSVLLEALACAAPIVATTAGGIPEVIRNEESGLLVPPRDSEGLGRTIVQTLNNPEEARRRARRGMDHLLEFSLTRCGKMLEEIYDSVQEHK